jgi:hypothetical protein
MEGMRRIGPLIAKARATIEAQAERIAALEAKCALLAASLDQEEKRSEALEAGLTDGVTDDMAVLQSRVEELEAQLRERGEPVAWEPLTDDDRTAAFQSLPNMLEGFLKTWGWLHFAKEIELRCKEKNAHPPAATSITLRDDPQPDGSRVVRAMDGEEEVARMCLPAAVATFTCAARRQGSAGGNDPADCDWPTCGCDEHASKVIAALQESGHLKEPASAASEWRPIESAPKDGVIQLWVPPFGIWVDGPWRGAWSYAAQQWVLHSPFTAADGRSICVTDIPHPTHWMPLPTAPSIAAQKERGE